VSQFLNAPCDKDAVDILYNVFTARDPEEGHSWIGVPRISLLNGLVLSDEFRVKCDALLSDGLHNLFRNRNRSILPMVKPFLMEMGAPEPRSDTWPDFLVAGIEAAKSVLDRDEIPESGIFVAQMIASDYQAAPEKPELLNELIRFDRDWILRSNKNVPALRDISVSELEALVPMIVVNGEAEISPYFKIAGPENHGLRRRIYGRDKRPIDFTLNDVILKLKIAFRNGLLFHWLFDGSYYESQREQAFTGGRVARWDPDENPYTDFLQNGDANNIRPHWLFCPTAYKSSIPASDISSRSGSSRSGGHLPCSNRITIGR
jgi:hypothetical protein